MHFIHAPDFGMRQVMSCHVMWGLGLTAAVPVRVGPGKAMSASTHFAFCVELTCMFELRLR